MQFVFGGTGWEGRGGGGLRKVHYGLCEHGKFITHNSLLYRSASVLLGCLILLLSLPLHFPVLRMAFFANFQGDCNVL